MRARVRARRAPRRARHVLAVAACALVLAACNDDGRTLDPAPTVPVSRETTTTTTAAAPDAGVTTDPTPASGLTLSSPAFGDGGVLGAEFSCHGQNVSPPLTISGVPSTAAELAIVVVDRDADGFVHWVLAGLPATIAELDTGATPAGAVAARTDSGVEGWDGPCPPPGDGPHSYVFTVYATAEPIGLAPGLDGRDAIRLIDAAAIASDSITARFESPG